MPVMGNGTHAIVEDEEAFLHEIIETMNDAYGAELTEEDTVDMTAMTAKIFANEQMVTVMRANNTPDDKRKKFDEVFDEVLLAHVTTKFNLYEKLSQPQVNRFLKQKWFEAYQQQLA